MIPSVTRPKTPPTGGEGGTGGGGEGGEGDRVSECQLRHSHARPVRPRARASASSAALRSTRRASATFKRGAPRGYMSNTRYMREDFPPRPRPNAAPCWPIRRRSWSREHRASCGERMRDPSGPCARASASSAAFRSTSRASATLKRGGGAQAPSRGDVHAGTLLCPASSPSIPSRFIN